MKNNLRISLLALLAVFTTSCNTGPQAIDYGNDGCHYCKMTIVDKIHGAEFVTEKGKVYKFDATECMLNYAQDAPIIDTGIHYTNYYESPTILIPSSEAAYLISQELPSPMGANLTAFKDKSTAEKIQLDLGGTLYNWDELKSFLNK